jgi:predicted nucleotidyltransferase
MVDSVLSDAERRFLEALQERSVRYLVVGMSAALLQGARGATEDIDLWFEDPSDPGIADAAREAGGFWVSGSFGMRPPALGGDELSDRFDVVVHMHGLRDFATEYAQAPICEVDGVKLRVLPLDRIIESKRATGRSRDEAQIPALTEALAAIEGEDE